MSTYSISLREGGACVPLPVRRQPVAARLQVQESRRSPLGAASRSSTSPSFYPKEREYLYPPLTYLQPIKIYEQGCTVVEVMPQMS